MVYALAAAFYSILISFPQSVAVASANIFHRAFQALTLTHRD